MSEEVARPLFPTHLETKSTRFGRFSTDVARMTSHAGFFIFCVAIVLIWAPTYFLIGDVNTWQLIINSTTTIITFLLVALLQSTQARDTTASQKKLNAIADALADFMLEYAKNLDNPTTLADIQQDVDELKAAVGLEEMEI